MYPKVFLDYAEHRSHNADVSVLPTPVFFYGMNQNDEISVDLEKGKTLVIRYLTTSEAGDEEGNRTVFFELNGQPRTVKVADKTLAASGKAKPKPKTAMACMFPLRCRALWSKFTFPKARRLRRVMSCARLRR